jgi:amphi-Trp domain-containing protein
MSDLEITYKEPVTRAETARTLSALTEALANAGKVQLALGHTTMTVRVPDEVQCKVEVEIDEVEFEIELRWSTSPRPERPTPVDDRAGRNSDAEEAGEPSEHVTTGRPVDARPVSGGSSGERSSSRRKTRPAMQNDTPAGGGRR